jgi:hypothetical protein
MGQRKIDEIIEYYSDEELLQADGLDDAIIGVVSDFNSEIRLAYSTKLCLDIFMKQGMSHEEALEYFDYNVKGAYMGEKTPVWVDDMMYE